MNIKNTDGFERNVMIKENLLQYLLSKSNPTHKEQKEIDMLHMQCHNTWGFIKKCEQQIKKG